MYESYHLGLFLTDIVSKMGAIIFRVIVIAALISDFAFELGSSLDIWMAA
jgi:hypothetical protein